MQPAPFTLNDGFEETFTPGAVLQSSGGVLVHKLGDDAQLEVRFYKKHIPIIAKSQNGITHFEEQDYVEIYRPNDKSWIVDRKARDHDKRRFAEQWYRYKIGKTQQVGTPITELFERNLVTQYELEMLLMAKFKTIEQLSGGSENVISALGPSGLRLQKLATGFLNFKSQVEGKEGIAKLQTEMEANKAEIEKTKGEVEAKLAEATALVAELNQKKKGGRPAGSRNKKSKIVASVIKQLASQVADQKMTEVNEPVVEPVNV